MKYFCYDTALNEEYTLIQLMQKYPRHTNLFAGTDDERIWDAAPWLFELNSNPYELKGQNLIQLKYCIVFETKEPVKSVLDYLHSKIYINENGQDRFFRIWNAKILVNSIKTWCANHVSDFFNVFDAFYTESDDDAYLDKWFQSVFGKIGSLKVLKSEALPLIKSEEELDREYEALHQQKKAIPAPQPQTEKAPEQIIESIAEEKPKRRRFLAD